MLQIRSTHGFHATETRLRMAAREAGGSILAITDMSAMLHAGAAQGPTDPGTAMAVTLCFTDLYTPLLAADLRFAAFLPLRVAICEKGGGTFLEAISPRGCCRLLHRIDLEEPAAILEDRLREVMETAATAARTGVEPHTPTEEQVNMRAALPQRVDCRGTKIEELAGTGKLDTQGG